MDQKKINNYTIIALFITFISCSLIFSGTFPAEKNITAEMRSIYNKLKGKADPLTLMKLKTAAKNFKKEINFSQRGQDDLALAKKHCRIFSGPGKDVTWAAFIVMMEVWKDMDDDIRKILGEIKVMAEVKNKLREMIKDLNSWISDQMENSKEDTIENKPIKNEPVRNSRSKMKPAKIRIPVFKKHPPLLKKKRKTPNFGLEYFVAPKIKKLGNYKTRSKPYLKELLKKYESDLKNLGGITKEEALKLQLAMERRQKIIQTISNILKKVSSSRDGIIQNKK